MKRMTAALLLFSVMALAVPTGASAQGTSMVWGEVGRTSDKVGLGEPVPDLQFGGGVHVVVGGKSQKDFAALFVYGAEIRTDKSMDFFNGVYFADIGFRTKNLSFGPGATFTQAYRPEIFDPTCSPFVNTPAPVSSSCRLGGLREIGQLYGVGFGGYVKGNFGPQGRAFAQVRLIFYPAATGILRSGREIAGAGPSLTPDDFPDLDSLRDIRMSGGYVFPRPGSRVALLVRAQYTNRQFTFLRELANTIGIFDQHTNQLTFGAGIAF